MSSAAAIDWGDGDYAPTAEALEPVAAVVLDAVGIEPGERLIDVGCGTGNALLEAARRGASVAGFDPSARLAAAAAARLSAEGLRGEVGVGSAEAPPPIAPADVVVSVFAVIFSPDPPAALKGMVQLARRGGRIALTSWLPSGAIADAGRILRAAVAVPDDAAVEPPHWGDPDWLTALLETAGAHDVATAEHDIVFRHDSPEAWFAGQEAAHPVWRAVRGQVSEPEWDDIRARSLAVLDGANEDPGAFAVTSSYLVVTAAR